MCMFCTKNFFLYFCQKCSCQLLSIHTWNCCVMGKQDIPKSDDEAMFGNLQKMSV